MYFINICDLINTGYPVYAHKNEEQYETLYEHISLCQKYYMKIMKARQLEIIVENCIRTIISLPINDKMLSFAVNMFHNVVTFHDCGKINPRYQIEQLKNCDIPIREFQGVGNHKHSLLSAILYLDNYLALIKEDTEFSREEKDKLRCLALLNAYVISRHHSDIDGIGRFIEILLDEGCYILEGFQNDSNMKLYCRELKYFSNSQRLSNILRSWNVHSAKAEIDQSICEFIYVRLLYSLLVASDYYATNEFNNGIETTYFGDGKQIEEFKNRYYETIRYKTIKQFEKEEYCYESTLSDITDINKLRNYLFIDAEKRLIENIDNLIFFLEAPTGSGKSNIAFNLSYRLLNERTDKIFYVYPFNTLVEQNYTTLKDIYGANKDLLSKITVLNSLTPIAADNSDENSKEYYEKALLDRQFLNYPFILTTHVNLFDVMFGTNKGSLFGFYQLAGSVIVLDEIQSYRNRIWTEIITFLKYFAKVLNIKIIIMSATLPDMDYLLSNKNENQTIHLDRCFRLIKNAKKYFEHELFKNRVKLNFKLLNNKIDLVELREHIFKGSIKNKKILVEFNVKHRAREFYELMKEYRDENTVIEQIDGDTGMYYREKILSSIRKSNDKTVILIATQVVEAGVDIDMDIGYKEVSKLDSEEQFLGRIHRNCSPDKEGTVYFFIVDEAKKIYKDDQRINRELTLFNEEMREILLNKSFDIYYKKVMELIIKYVNNISNEKGIEDFFDNALKPLDFQKISERMALISDDRQEERLYLAHTMNFSDGSELDGRLLWKQYKELLSNTKISYAEKQVKLSVICSKMNHFIYRVRKSNIPYCDIVGGLKYIENGDHYLENGRLIEQNIEIMIF